MASVLLIRRLVNTVKDHNEKKNLARETTLALDSDVKNTKNTKHHIDNVGTAPIYDEPPNYDQVMDPESEKGAMRHSTREGGVYDSTMIPQSENSRLQAPTRKMGCCERKRLRRAEKLERCAEGRAMHSGRCC